MDANRPGPVMPNPNTASTQPTPPVQPGAAKPIPPGIILPPKSPPAQANPPSATQPATPGVPKIQHKQPNFAPAGAPSTNAPALNRTDEPRKPLTSASDISRPLPVADGPALGGVGGKITAFGKERRHEDTWSRSPNTTGAGAIHVKTFHCKLTDDALAYMDQSINEWLDAHPEYEIKFVSSTIGIMTGKLKEPALVCQVWV